MDWLEDRPELAEPRARLMATIERTGPWLRWILLTKRPQNFARLAPAWAAAGCPDNVWFGISAGSQRSLDRQVEAFTSVNAAHKLISGEPLIGPVDFRPALRLRGVKWLILGGESGGIGDVRPCEEEVMLDGIAAGRELGKAVFVKQLGRNPTRGGRSIGHIHHKGEDPREWAPDLRIQEWPDGSAYLHTEAA
jgi:protein gp37